MINELQRIQKQWLNANQAELDVENLALPDNVKNTIYQANKHDQKRECLILMAQMQSLLVKPTPQQLRPQLESFPSADSYQFLFNQKKEILNLASSIISKESLFDASPTWKFLSKFKILIRPVAFLSFLDRAENDNYRYSFYINKNIPVYKEWWKWYKKNKIKTLTHKDLSNEIWDTDRFRDEFGYSSNYDKLDSLRTVLAYKNEEFHKQIITAIRYSLADNMALLHELQEQSHLHWSNETRTYISNVLSRDKLRQEDIEICIKNAANNLELKGNQLSKINKKWIDPEGINSSFDYICKLNLWSQVANTLGLTIDQFFDFMEESSFSGNEISKFYNSFLLLNEISQDIINRKYIKSANSLADSSINNKNDQAKFNTMTSSLGMYADDKTKYQIDYNFLFNDNFYGYHITLTSALGLNSTFAKRFNLDEMLYCLNTFKVHSSVLIRNYKYDKHNSQPYVDYLFFDLSKETAQAYLDYLLESGITDQTSERDNMILNTLRLNIIMNGLRYVKRN